MGSHHHLAGIYQEAGTCTQKRRGPKTQPGSLQWPEVGTRGVCHKPGDEKDSLGGK